MYKKQRKRPTPLTALHPWDIEITLMALLNTFKSAQCLCMLQGVEIRVLTRFQCPSRRESDV